MCHLKIWSFSTPLLGASQLDRSINLSKFLLQQVLALLLLVVLNRGCGDAKKSARETFSDVCKFSRKGKFSHSRYLQMVLFTETQLPLDYWKYIRWEWVMLELQEIAALASQ